MADLVSEFLNDFIKMGKYEHRPALITLNDLAINQLYQIDQFFMAKATSGVEPAASILGANKWFYLPSRFRELVKTVEDCEILNKQGLSMRYRGQDTKKNNAFILDFFPQGMDTVDGPSQISGGVVMSDNVTHKRKGLSQTMAQKKKKKAKKNVVSPSPEDNDEGYDDQSLRAIVSDLVKFDK
jgi:hypothetical protein